MKHTHHSLSAPSIIEHAEWHYGNARCDLMLMLIRHLSRKSYAPDVAAFWTMHWFNIAGPMKWTGQRFEGEATAFVVIDQANDQLIRVSFHDSNGETVEPQAGSLEESERLVDALVLRILHQAVA